MRTDDCSIVAIGRVGSAAGIRGEFRVNLYAADSDNLKEGRHLLFRHAGACGANGAEPFELSTECRGIRHQNGRPVVRIEGVDDRNAAEALRGMEICIKADELEKLPEGEHYVRDLIGCRVIDIAGGKSKDIGILKDVLQYTSQSILEVERYGGITVLIPAVDEFLRRIDEDERIIELELIPGFYED